MDRMNLADLANAEEMEFREAEGQKEARPGERQSQKDSLGLPEEMERRGTATLPEPLPAAPVRYPVMLTIHANQDLDSFQPERMELMTEGFLEREGDALALIYEESSMTGMEGTTTIFRIQGPRLYLQRAGTVSSQMVFEKGILHTSLYETPYGELSVDIFTSFLRCNLTEEGGEIEVRFSISVEHASVGKNRFHMRVRRRR